MEKKAYQQKEKEILIMVVLVEIIGKIHIGYLKLLSILVFLDKLMMLMQIVHLSSVC